MFLFSWEMNIMFTYKNDTKCITLGLKSGKNELICIKKITILLKNFVRVVIIFYRVSTLQSFRVPFHLNRESPWVSEGNLLFKFQPYLPHHQGRHRPYTEGQGIYRKAPFPSEEKRPWLHVKQIRSLFCPYAKQHFWPRR